MTRARRVREDFIRPIGPSAPSKKELAKEAIRWLIRRNPHNIPEVAEHFGLHKSLVSEILGEMLENLEVVRKQDGRYAFRCFVWEPSRTAGQANDPI